MSDATVSHQWVRAVDKNWVFFEEYTDSKENANFYLLNRTTGEVTTVKENENMPLIHHINAFFTEDEQLVFNIVKDNKKDTSSNTLYLLEPTAMKEQVIDQILFHRYNLIENFIIFVLMQVLTIQKLFNTI